MKIKSGVSLAGLQPCMREAIIAANKVMRSHSVPLVITSGTDGCHSAGSLHYYGYAIDIRTRQLSDVTGAHKELKAMLPGFDVILERTHIHIENEVAFKEAL